MLKYETVSVQPGIAVSATTKENGFELTTADGTLFFARKLLFATGVKDLMPAIPSVLPSAGGLRLSIALIAHGGYEVKTGEKAGIMSNGDLGFEFSKLIANLTLGPHPFYKCEINPIFRQQEKLQKHNIGWWKRKLRGLNTTMAN